MTTLGHYACKVSVLCYEVISLLSKETESVSLHTGFELTTLQ